MEKAASGVSRLQPLVFSGELGRRFTVVLIVANQAVITRHLFGCILGSVNAVFVGFAQAEGLDKISGIGGFGGAEEGNFVAAASPALRPPAGRKRLRRGCLMAGLENRPFRVS